MRTRSCRELTSGNGVAAQYYPSRPVGNIRHFVAKMVPTVDLGAPQSQDIVSPRGMCLDMSSSNKLLGENISDEDGLEYDGDKIWPFQSFVEQLILDMFDPLWEVRHGSVMAMREILTHQGANAGVIFPDLRCDSALNIKIEERVDENTVKRERPIDLNMQVSPDELVSVSKKLKVEPEDASYLVMDTMACTSRDGDPGGVSVKVEDAGLSLAVEQANVEFSTGLMPVMGGGMDKTSMEKMGIRENLPENCELMNLVKLARHSGLKNCEFLQDCAIRFLCVLALDRFGDYVSDQVVAPVRETCAQALGARRPEWEIRHGSLLGIKYLVAVRQKMLPELLGCVLPACKAGLEDPDDDVRDVAADALLPTAASLVALNGQLLNSIIILLWDILLDLDDLSPSTSSVMNLLAEIYSQEQMIPKTFGEQKKFDLNETDRQDALGEGTWSSENPYMLATLAPRLWPFMRHSITSVRYSAIRTLERLLEAEYKRSVAESSSSFWPSFVLGDTLRIVFQNLLLESNEEIVQCSGRVWRILLQCPVEDLEAASKAYFPSWLVLISTCRSRIHALLLQQSWVASMVLISWFKELKTRNSLDMDGVVAGISSNFRSWLMDLLACTNPAFPTKDSLLPYIELARTYDKMRNEARQLYHATESSDMFKDLLSSIPVDLDNLSADDAIGFASTLQFPSINTAEDESAERNSLEELETFKQRLLTTSRYLKCVQNNLHVTVSSLLAAAVVWMNELPVKLNPIILPLMASIKREQEEILQSKAAEALAELIYRCMGRKPGPNDKLIKNLCSLTCMDPCETPQAGVLNSIEIIEEQDLLSSGSSSNRHKSKVHMLSPGEDRSKVEGFISRRGSELALKFLCETLGGSLEVLKLCSLEGMTAEDERLIAQAIELVKDPQNLINNIQVVRSIAPMLDETLRPKILTLLPCIFRCVHHSHIAVRLAASRCITTMAKSMTLDVMGSVINNVVPMLGDVTSVHSKQGAGMLVSLLVQGLGIELVPYAPLLVVPLLRCMSDSDHTVRQSVTHSFATLVPLLPLARGVSPPVGLCEHLSRSQEDVKFLEQLIDNSHIGDYKLSTDHDSLLCFHKYQQEGINWLAFLKRFNLHGVLCDDMGLGKTLQASAIVASDVAEHIALNSSQDLPPSLIICPSTLVGHRVYEIEKFIDGSLLSTLQDHNVIVTSYDVIRKDVAYLRQLFWNYCILDEGHIIKNSKSKITVLVKQSRPNTASFRVEHRYSLFNNVLDLWSLFDFLMPGFLGTERQFYASYGKPLLASRDPKCSSKDAEAGVLAMEALHKQVMPFLLRRTKDEVLSDLPEKIIQDRYCDLSPVQLKLYEQFSGSHVRQEISIMALQYLLKLCSHPLLVFGERVSESLSSVVSDLFSPGSDIVSELHQLHHSPKLVALQEILSECGIGVDSVSEGTICVGQHRVLIFAQHKALLDIIERDLFQNHMKNVTYLRLDGSVEPEKRFDIVKAFNSDPTIDVLLLTTHVGGLGLNLTSADTLVFMEHDWNPMRYHQAMDRAHRLGQRKVVNVHRLIMRGTLEEKVMSLQRFKVSVANAVINAENASLKTMNTDQLLDLFTSAECKKGASRSKRTDEKSDVDSILPRSGKGLKAILGGLEELWDQSQYTEEYNLGKFLAKLNG
ncbi:unnamed protein product [Withania somnifera]